MEGSDAVAWVKEILTLSSPFVAAAIGILLFFAKAAQQRADELRRERLTVYRQYLVVLQEHSKEDYETPADAGTSLMEKLSPLQDQIALMAPDAVAKASLRLIGSNIGDHLWTDGKRVQYLHKLGRRATKTETEAYLAATEPFRAARRSLLKEMRKDIVQGTGIDGYLTDVEELKQ
jgi:hypothetical protein